MTKFNKKLPTRVKLSTNPTATVNKAGGLAFKASAKTDLTLRAVTALMSGEKYYTTASQTYKELNESIDAVLAKDPEYILKLAVFCRTEMHLRSLPIWLLARYAVSGVSIPNTRHYVNKIIQRADEITEIISACFSVSNGLYGRNTLPNLIKHGLNDSFNKFDAYQFAKYNRDGEVKLRDALFLCHPKAKDAEQQLIFDGIANRTLVSADTWERSTCESGSTKKVWDDIVPRMGHMAILRNLRNLLLAGANLNPVINQLTDKKAILNGKQFPFRYLTAAKAITQIPNSGRDYGSYLDGIDKVLGGLHEAMDISVANIPKIKGRTLFLVDNSGSMSSRYIGTNPNKKVRPDDVRIKAIEIAGLFGAMASSICERHTVIAFGEKFKEVVVPQRDSVITNAERIRNTNVGQSTNAHLPIIDITEKMAVYDRIILLSDMQCYDDYGVIGSLFKRGSSSVAEAFLDYQKKVNQNVYLHSVDLTGYGTILLPENTRNVSQIGGWSEKIFDFIPLFESNKQTLVEYIDSYTK
jgi:hypothetical protein